MRSRFNKSIKNNRRNKKGGSFRKFFTRSSKNSIPRNPQADQKSDLAQVKREIQSLAKEIQTLRSRTPTASVKSQIKLKNHSLSLLIKRRKTLENFISTINSVSRKANNLRRTQTMLQRQRQQQAQRQRQQQAQRQRQQQTQRQRQQQTQRQRQQQAQRQQQEANLVKLQLNELPKIPTNLFSTKKHPRRKSSVMGHHDSVMSHHESESNNELTWSNQPYRLTASNEELLNEFQNPQSPKLTSSNEDLLAEFMNSYGGNRRSRTKRSKKNRK